MRRANRGRELQILADGQVLIERVFLRNVADVFFEIVQVWIERATIQKNLPARWLKLSGQNAEQRAFSGTTRAHHTNELAARERK